MLESLAGLLLHILYYNRRGTAETTRKACVVGLFRTHFRYLAFLHVDRPNKIFHLAFWLFAGLVSRWLVLNNFFPFGFFWLFQAAEVSSLEMHLLLPLFGSAFQKFCDTDK